MQLMQNFMDGHNLIYWELCKYLGKKKSVKCVNKWDLYVEKNKKKSFYFLQWNARVTAPLPLSWFLFFMLCVSHGGVI